MVRTRSGWAASTSNHRVGVLRSQIVTSSSRACADVFRNPRWRHHFARWDRSASSDPWDPLESDQPDPWDRRDPWRAKALPAGTADRWQGKVALAAAELHREWCPPTGWRSTPKVCWRVAWPNFLWCSCRMNTPAAQSTMWEPASRAGRTQAKTQFQRGVRNQLPITCRISTGAYTNPANIRSSRSRESWA